MTTPYLWIIGYVLGVGTGLLGAWIFEALYYHGYYRDAMAAEEGDHHGRP